MTKDEVLNAMINLFKNINAVNSQSTLNEIRKVRMNDLAWFQMDLGIDEDFKKEVLFKMLEACITNINNGVQPSIEPPDYTLFDYPDTMEEVADTIAAFS